MRMRYKLPIVTLVGVGVLLLSSLAVIFAPRAQTVYAQDPPQLFVSMGEVSLPQGGSTYVAATVHNLPRDPMKQDQLVELTYGRDLFRVLSGGSTENANGCANGMGGNTPVNLVYANPKVIGGGSEDNFTITSSCPAGSYRVRMSVRLKGVNTDLVFGTKDFTVIPGPSVTIALSSDSFFRGTSSNVTITFNHLPAGANLSYRTYVLQLRPTNYAESCEGAGLGAQVAMNSVATTEVRNGTIAAACPTGEYELFVVLYNSSNGELTSTSIEFVVSTDPTATPSATVELSPPSPVTPGTAIEATITVYDLQDGANLEFRTDVIKRVNNADVVESRCHDGEVGLGQEFGFTVGRNPFILSATISSNCPAGSYKLKSVISDGSGNEIVSGSADFTVGVIEANRAPVVTISTASASLEGGAMLVISGKATDPDSDSVDVSASTTGGALSAVTLTGDDWSVTLTAPAVTANLQTITVTISGEDPAGLTATASRAWTVGANVDPTVTINQADMTVDGGASVDLSAVVAAPEAGQSVSTLWTATGGSYPDGDSGTTVRWVAPAGGQTDTGYTLTATATDALGATASDSIEVTVREDPNLRLIAPTVLNQTGTVGTAYTQTLDAWTGGVAPLRYTVTGQPGGLSFNEGTRTITGIPIEPVISEVTYTVTDNDGNGDEASTTFTITIIEANRAPVVTISTASARLEGGATQVISGEATDPEGDSVEVSASTTGGALSAVTRSGDDWSVTLTAPAVTANPQTITVTISGEDPAGLTATASRAWTVGANVDPTVTIDQADMTVDGGASVDLSAVVAAPEAGQSVSTLWTATGGSYPDGDSGTTVRWVAPASGQTDTGYTLTATAEDALGATASDSIEVTVRADPNATLFAPTVLNQNGRVGTPYTQTLDAWTGGVGRLRYTVTGQPDGLSFNEGTRTITGIPVEAGRSLVTYTVTDNDGNGDEASTTFTITVAQELSLSVSMGEVSLPQGGSTYIAATVHNLPRGPNNQGSLPELTYGRDLFRVLSDESTENANGCANGMGGNTPVNSVYANPKTIGVGWDNFTIKSDCPTGSYRVRMSVKYKDANTDLVFGTKDFTVVPRPSVTVELPSASFYRGTSSDVTMGFSYLNNMQDGSDLSYRADIIRRVTETTNNFADKCEGAGLGNIDKSDDSDSHLSNLGDSPSGAIEDQDGDGAVEVSGQIPTTCPTGRYKLTVELWDSSNSELTSTSIEFVVSTDPNATPSATVELSPPSPVTPGTAIEATITVYDLQDGADLEYRIDVIKRVNNADVVESSCHDGGIGLGQEFGFTVGRNPFVISETISSNCPAGSYTLKSVITDGSSNEIVSGAVNFEITNSPQRRPSQPPGGNSNNGGGNSNNGGGRGEANPNNGGGNSEHGVAAANVFQVGAASDFGAATVVYADRDHPAGDHERAVGAGSGIRSGRDCGGRDAGQNHRHRRTG